MGLALEEAKKAYALGEVPVGAVLVLDGEVIARGHNTTESAKNALCHAELIAIAEGAKAMDAWRLSGTTLYVTLEPCAMCAGAIVNSRIDRLVIGAYDEKRGCCGSLINLVDDPAFNHRVALTVEVEQDLCVQLLQDFFRERREEKRAVKKGAKDE